MRLLHRILKFDTRAIQPVLKLRLLLFDLFKQLVLEFGDLIDEFGELC